MNKELLHKIISTWIAIAVVLPMSIQFAHAMEDHSHDICKENAIQHIHEHKIECEFDHYFFKTNAFRFNELFQDETTIHYADSPAYFSKTFYETSFSSINTRGPPQSII